MDCCQEIIIQVSTKDVVFVQGLFEIHENIAVVKTIDVEKSILALYTTNDYKEVCLNILESVKNQISLEILKVNYA